MRVRPIAAAFVLLLLVFSVPAQEKAGADQRGILQQVLIQNYQPSDVGKKMMGVGAESDIRRPGIIVVVQRTGLYGSLSRNEIASSAIHGLDAKLYRGHQDYEIPVGERFYVTIVNVGSSTINFGLLSARAIATKNGTGRVWTAPTFYFPEKVLAEADKDTVIQGIDPWFVPEGRNLSAAPGMLTMPVAAPGQQTQPATQSSNASLPQSAGATISQTRPSPTAHLVPGMTADEVVAALGRPMMISAFNRISLMQYSGLILKFEDDKLVSVEPQAYSTSASVSVESDPHSAEIYLDGQLVGSTPASLQVPAGDHQLVLKLAGYQDWSRQVHFLPSSYVTFAPKLTKP
jgi:hypothetical protein